MVEIPEKGDFYPRIFGRVDEVYSPEKTTPFEKLFFSFFNILSHLYVHKRFDIKLNPLVPGIHNFISVISSVVTHHNLISENRHKLFYPF